MKAFWRFQLYNEVDISDHYSSMKKSSTQRDQVGDGNSTPLQSSCLENPMDRGAWQAAVHGVAESWTRLSDFTLTFHFHALEKEMATHSSVLAWRIPGIGEPGGLPSIGLHRVRHNWSDLAAAAAAALFLKELRKLCLSVQDLWFCTELEPYSTHSSSYWLSSCARNRKGHACDLHLDHSCSLFPCLLLLFYNSLGCLTIRIHMFLHSHSYSVLGSTDIHHTLSWC